MKDSTGINFFFFRTQSFLNVLTHCGLWITSRDEYCKAERETEL